MEQIEVLHWYSSESKKYKFMWLFLNYIFISLNEDSLKHIVKEKKLRIKCVKNVKICK